MNAWHGLLLPLFFCLGASTPSCTPRVLSKHRVAANLNFDISYEVNSILRSLAEPSANFSAISKNVLSTQSQISGIFLALQSKGPTLALNLRGRLKIFPNKSAETEVFWSAFRNATNGWNAPFKDCILSQKTWFHLYVSKYSNSSVGVLIPLIVNQCDPDLEEIFGGPDKCDKDTTYCVPIYEYGDKPGGYRCVCRTGFYYQGANYSWKGFSGEDLENGNLESNRCSPCPPQCDVCEAGGICLAKRDVYLKTVILGLHLACMGLTVIMALVVFKQRKTKTIASGMWTVLETILLGIFLLYSTVVVRFFEPSVLQCMIEPWARELGFIICYGAIVLKLYRHLIEFRTRKAHRWVIKDTDLLKYLFIMTLSVLAYMAAYTSLSLNFMQENYSLLYKGITLEGVHYEACKPLWWDYVTEIAELTILIFGIHMSYASRNARTPFHERRFLCAAISLELAVSTIFYLSRIFVFPGLHPDIVFISYCVRTQATATMTLLLVFVPKFWYQQKQVRSLAQEYSCRLPVDAFKDVNAHGPLTSNNSDIEVSEVTLADMSPDDIRAELKRLYMQLEIFKNKTICRDNPHISKRRGGRKPQHRRFSLQNLYGKHKERKQAQQPEETTEAEPSRTPEDSVCSNEGPSAIYADMPSTATADYRT